MTARIQLICRYNREPRSVGKEPLVVGKSALEVYCVTRDQYIEPKGEQDRLLRLSYRLRISKPHH